MEVIRVLPLILLLTTPIAPNPVPTHLFLLGGAMKDTTASVYNSMRESTGVAGSPRIAVAISGAPTLEDGLDAYYTDIPGSLSYENLFKMYGFVPEVLNLAIDNFRSGSSSGNPQGQANIDIVNNADVVFFNGGDQSRHSRCWFNDDGSDSDIMAALKERVAQGKVVIAGTSAGTAIQSNPTFGSGTSYGYFYYNADLKPCQIGEAFEDDRGTSFRLDYNGAYTQGFNFIENIIVDTHFDARGRFARLAVAMRQVGTSVGIGIGEDTALHVITTNSSSTATALGSGGVWIIDSTSAYFPPAEEYFTAEHLRVSYLTESDTYDLTSKEVSSSSPPMTTGPGKPHSSGKIFDSDEAINSILSLALSTEASVVNLSEESEPRAEVIFKKTDSTLTFYTSNTKFTISELLFDIKSQ